MARADFGGSASDFVASTYTLGSSRLLRLASATLFAWDAETGGNQITDLLVDGAAASSVPVGADGQIPTFQGPDGVTTLWLSAGLSGERFRFTSQDEAAIQAAKDAAEAAAARAEAVPATTDGIVEGLLNDPESATATRLSASYAPLGESMRPLRAVAIGTSIYAGGLRAIDATVILNGNTWDANENTSVGMQQAGPESWFTYLCLLSGGRILNVYNAGIASDLLSNMVTRFQADVLDHDPDIVFLGDAVNEINNGVTDTLIRGYIGTMVDAARAAGVTPILVSTITQTDSAKALRARQHNAWLAKYAAENRLHYIDPFAAVIDTASSTAALVAGYTSDGLHLNATGAKVAGQKALDDLSGILRGNTTASRAAFLPQTSANGTALNLLPNPLFLTDSNADGKADSWGATGAGTTWSLVTDAAILGKAQKMVVASSTVNFNKDTTIDGTNLSVGDRVAFSGMYKAEASGGALNYQVYLSDFAANVKPHGQVVGLDMDWTPFYCEFVVPAGKTLVRAGIQSIAGTGTLYLAQVQLRNLTKAGLA